MTNHLRKLVLLFLICASVASGWLIFAHYKPRRDFGQLLAGDGRVQLSSLVIRGQGKLLKVDDPSAMEYLTTAFRTALGDCFKSGLSYEVNVHLSSGGFTRCVIMVPEDEDSIVVCFPLDGIAPDTMVYHLVKLPEPIPESLSEVLDQLRPR